MTNNDETFTGKRDTGILKTEHFEDADGYHYLTVYRVEQHEDADGYWWDVDVRIGGGMFDSYENAKSYEASLT